MEAMFEGNDILIRSVDFIIDWDFIPNFILVAWVLITTL
jgi:hypothetical protein